MSDPIQLIGIYKVERHEDVHLIELDIKVSPENVHIGEFTQVQKGVDRLNWQSPWDEKYLNLQGDKIIGDWMDLPDNKTEYTRLAFFMHHLDLNKPLLSQFGELSLTTPQEMPTRLKSIIEYETP